MWPTIGAFVPRGLERGMEHRTWSIAQARNTRWRGPRFRGGLTRGILGYATVRRGK
jgi:hypothetical protein